MTNNRYLYEVQCCVDGLYLAQDVKNYENESIKEARRLTEEWGLEECKDPEIKKTKTSFGIEIIAIKVNKEEWSDYCLYSTIDIETILNNYGYCIANSKVIDLCKSCHLNKVCRPKRDSCIKDFISFFELLKSTIISGALSISDDNFDNNKFGFMSTFLECMYSMKCKFKEFWFELPKMIPKIFIHHLFFDNYNAYVKDIPELWWYQANGYDIPTVYQGSSITLKNQIDSSREITISIFK